MAFLYPSNPLIKFFYIYIIIGVMFNSLSCDPYKRILRPSLMHTSADFGLSKQFNGQSFLKSNVGTLIYSCPEIVKVWFSMVW